MDAALPAAEGTAAEQNYPNMMMPVATVVKDADFDAREEAAKGQATGCARRASTCRPLTSAASHGQPGGSVEGE